MALRIENSSNQYKSALSRKSAPLAFTSFRRPCTSTRCTSFGPYFNNGNQNSFYIELTKTDDYCCECLGNQASFTVEIYWRFDLNFSWVSMLFLNSWRVSSHIVRYDTNPPAIQKQYWHSREAHIEPPLIECEWAFRLRAYISYFKLSFYITIIFRINITPL
jgi:hypothetical protein